ncbi:14819_t:CDS:2, partial [Entrophospora sp. SA101]
MDRIYVGKCCLSYWNEDNLTAKDKLADDFLQIPQIQIQVSVVTVINFNILQEVCLDEAKVLEYLYKNVGSEHAFFQKFEPVFDGHRYLGDWILASLPNESNSNLPCTQRFASNGFLIKAS